MNGPSEKPAVRHYKWPWFALAAFLLAVALAILWMSFEGRKVEQERNVNAPVPGSRTN